MHSTEIVSGRRLALALEPGDDVLGSIGQACSDHGIAQAVIVTFSGAFRRVRLIATHHDDRPDPEEPLTDAVEVTHVEGVGSGTVATLDDGTLSVHVHVAVGVRAEAGAAYAGHLLAGEAQYVVEVVLDEVLEPRTTRSASDATRGVPAWRFLDTSAEAPPALALRQRHEGTMP